ncbi:MAG: c-type cytochrome biogenesis protein CcsB [Actinomycetota bacterium]|nr:c-type cytochrome biogenesis protein CcsB [Actinomycetota bacterium]
MTAADFAGISNSAIAFASVVYVLAFLAHLVEWVLGRGVPVEPVVSPAGRGSTTSACAQVGGTERTAVAPTSLVPRSARQDRPATAVLQVPPASGGSNSAGYAGGGDAAVRVEKYGRIGVALTVVAGLLHLVALVTRGLGADPVRVPWGNMYEFSLAGALGVTLFYLALLRKHHLRWLGPVVTGFNVVILMLAVLILYVPAGPLVPALDSYWLVIHVIAAITATGAFTVGGMASVLFLIRARAESRGQVAGAGYISRLPPSTVLDRVAYRMHAFGFPIWTFAALIAGPIWAEYAWGRYWGWDPKEVWAFITWVVYAAYLHARATAGWRGKATAIIALVGLATLLFNFVGINFFFGNTSQHSYAG